MIGRPIVALAVVLGVSAVAPPAGAAAETTCAKWKVVASPAVPASDLSTLAAVGPDDIWGVGNNFNGGPPMMEHWDGASWTRQRSAVPSGTLHSVAAASDGTVWAVGIDFVLVAERLEGGTWVRHDPPYPPGGMLFGSVAISSTDVWAVGQYTGNVIHGLAQHWDGNSWTTIADDPLLYGEIFLAASASGSADVWAVGYGTGADLNSGAVTEHWDGTKWTNILLPPLGDDSLLTGVYSSSPSDAWAVGYYNYSGFPAIPLVLHWDGAVWTQMDVPYPTGLSTSLGRVSASGPNDVWAVGMATSTFGLSRPISEHYDGTTWILQKPPFAGDQAALGPVLALSPTNVWAAGSQIGNEQTPLIEHSNGCR